MSLGAAYRRRFRIHDAWNHCELELHFVESHVCYGLSWMCLIARERHGWRPLEDDALRVDGLQGFGWRSSQNSDLIRMISFFVVSVCEGCGRGSWGTRTDLSLPNARLEYDFV